MEGQATAESGCDVAGARYRLPTAKCLADPWEDRAAQGDIWVISLSVADANGYAGRMNTHAGGG